MKFYRAEQIDSLTIPTGEPVRLESLRQAVVPPYLMLMPFLEAPDGVTILNQSGLDEDGIHGCVYELQATQPTRGELRIGFRDLQTNQVTHEKKIHLETA